MHCSVRVLLHGGDPSMEGLQCGGVAVWGSCSVGELQCRGVAMWGRCGVFVVFLCFDVQ